MPPYRHSFLSFRPTLSFILLGVLLATLWVAGGASRADLPGQVVVTSAAWALLIASILLGRRPAETFVGPALILLSLAIALCVTQLVPLPPSIWQTLPSRDVLAEAAAVGGQVQPWRPWSIVPGATASVLSSLVVPMTVWVLVAGLTDKEREWLPALLLGVVVASMLLGLLQFSGAALDNPLINDTSGEVGGTFANRNHFALFLAMGCLLAPTWAFAGNTRANWRAPLAGGLVLLFLLTILASGSRAGLALGLVALLIGLAMSRRGLRRALAPYSRWVLPAVVGGVVAVVAAFILASFLADRAVSIDRLFISDPGQDMRTRGLATAMAMISEYLPLGAGLGTFDPMFRIHEPFALLKPTYFNHVHNDFLEIALDAGVPGLLLLVGAVGWWAWASICAWRGKADGQNALPRLGSALLLLVILASIVDYPARTPMIMAVMVIAATWLSSHSQGPRGSSLPGTSKQL